MDMTASSRSASAGSTLSGSHRRRQILLVHSSAELYGSDKACLAIARRSAREGHSIHVILPTDGPLRYRLEETDVTVSVFDPLILRRADLRRERALSLPAQWGRAVINDFRFSRADGRSYDLVYAHCMPSVGGLLLACFLSVPLVWHVHEIFGERPGERRIFEHLLSRADAIVAASAAVKDQLRSPVLRQRTRVAHSGATVPPHIDRVSPFTRPVPRIVCVGRLNHWKGQDVLIESIALLRDRDISVEAVLIGDVFRSEHHVKSNLEQLVTRLGLIESVHFLGHRSDAAEQMGQADVVVVPSTRPEPFGMVVVEAMALGRPVIASNAGGPAEIITSGKDGVLVPVNDPVALAAALEDLIKDPDRARELGHQAVSTSQRFTPDGMVDEVLRTYDDVSAG